MFKKTKILATIGPASDNEKTIEELAIAGVNAFRLNFSHGTHEYHLQNLQTIKKVEAKINKRRYILIYLRLDCRQTNL